MHTNIENQHTEKKSHKDESERERDVKPDRMCTFHLIQTLRRFHSLPPSFSQVVYLPKSSDKKKVGALFSVSGTNKMQF